MPDLQKTSQTSLGAQYGFNRIQQVSTHGVGASFVHRFATPFALGIFGSVALATPDRETRFGYTNQLTKVRSQAYGFLLRNYLTRASAFEVFLESGVAFQYLSTRSGNGSEYKPLGETDKKMDAVSIGISPGASYTAGHFRAVAYVVGATYTRLTNLYQDPFVTTTRAKAVEDFSIGLTPTLGVELIFQSR